MTNLFTNHKETIRAIRAAVDQYNKWRKNEDVKRNRQCGKKVAGNERKKIQRRVV